MRSGLRHAHGVSCMLASLPPRLQAGHHCVSVRCLAGPAAASASGGCVATEGGLDDQSYLSSLG